MDTNTEKKSKGSALIMFVISLIATIGFLIFLPEWFWVALPFLLTSLVELFGAM